MRRVALAAVAALACALLASLCPPASATLPATGEVTVAVVTDGPGPENGIVALVEEELLGHVPRGTRVRFKTDPAFDAAWDAERVPGVLRAALDDPEADLVLLVGSLVTFEASRPELDLPKPVVSALVQRTDLFPLPYSEEGRSLKPNLSFIVVPQRAGRDVEAFRELVSFRALHVAVTPEDLNNLADFREGLARYERELGIEIALVPVTPNIENSLAGFGGSVEAVYLTRLRRLSAEQRRALIGELTARRIPTFSMLGHPDVEAGAMAGITPDIEAQVVRRVAINLGRLIRGASTAELPVPLSVDTRLLINARTAVAVDCSPGTETRLFAGFLHPEALEPDAEPLALAQAMKLAEEGNTALTVTDAEVESVRQDQYRARSVLLPQLYADLNYVKSGVTFRNPLLGDDSADATTGSLTLRQQIYDDGAWADYRSSERRFEGSELEREADRLDLLADAGQAYLQMALAQALRRIEAENLRLTEDFLELARLRRDVGYSGRDEILRWESEVAQRRSALFRSERDVEAARITLNQILGVAQERRWLPEEFDIDPDHYLFLGGRLDPYFDDFRAMETLREVLVQVALENRPEIRVLGKAIEAQEIQLAQLKRRYWVPTFFADLSYSERFSASGNTLIIPEEDFYSFFVGASYPIFEGGRKRADLRRAASDLDGLTRQRDYVEERVEQRTRTALRGVENSFPRIRFSRQSASAAAENLDLVRERYAEGQANVTDLLEAQNQRFGADQLATASVYEFLIDFLELQRAVAWFEADKSDEEQARFAESIRAAVAQGRATAPAKSEETP